MLFSGIGILWILTQGYRIHRKFGIWDNENYFSILKISIFGHVILVGIDFGIWDIAIPET